MFTEREVDDSKKLLDRFAKEYETEYRAGRLRLARRSVKRRSLIKWRSILFVMFWVACIVAIAVIAIVFERHDVTELVRTLVTYIEERVSQ